MGVYEVSASGGEINLFPSSEIEEILQNIRMILTTPKGTVALDRNFGLSFNLIDDPEPRAMMKLQVEIMESIKKYEERADVLSVDFVPDVANAQNGTLIPKVKVRLRDG